jgi:serine/threonine protein kinase
VCFSDDQVFARKIVRIFGDITSEDAESEGRMFSELCRLGHSKAVVEVIKYGWLPRHPLMYYMDMEYCPETLESCIHGAGQKAQGSESGSVLDSGTDQMEVESLSTRMNQATTTRDESNMPSPEFDWESVVDIIDDINRGLVYLHQNGTVHRDLKPKNGNT